MTAWAGETLVATGILTILVVVLRAPVARLFGARAAYSLWLAPLLRLLVPPLPADAPLPDLGIYSEPAATAASPMLSASNAGFALADMLIGLWLAGGAAFLLFHIVAHHRFVGRAVAAGRRLSASPSGPEVIETPAVEGPIATGILRRRIFVPVGFEERLTTEQRRLAMAHERLHHRRGDLIALAASLVLLALHWFNPLAHLAHRVFRGDLEAACDAELAERLGPAQREDYARAIVGCASSPVPQAICTLTTVSDLKRRLTMLQWNHGAAARLTGLGCAILIAFGGAALTAPVQAHGTPAEPGETKEFVKKIEIRSADGRDVGHAGELRERAFNCPGEKFEVASDGGSAEKKQHVKFVLCAKQGESLLPALEKAAARLEQEDDIPADRKADILAKLRAKIAELRSKG